jgi:hypothetical protein
MAATIAVVSPLALAVIPFSIAKGIPAANNPTNNPIIEITTNNSTNVKPKEIFCLRISSARNE